MSNQDMITAILAAIQQDANLLKLLRFTVTNNIGNVVPPDNSPSPQLMAACQLLGIDTSGSQ